MERVSKRSAELMDEAKIEYLKNIVIKYMETQEHDVYPYHIIHHNSAKHQHQT
jgi:hypothetical protein